MLMLAKKIKVPQSDLEDLEKSAKIEKLLWEEVEKYISSYEDVVITSAVLIKIALSLYTVVLKDDKDVKKITQAAVKTIPQLRARMEHELDTSITLH